METGKERVNHEQELRSHHASLSLMTTSNRSFHASNAMLVSLRNDSADHWTRSPGETIFRNVAKPRGRSRRIS
jgi:hypothetical protein